MLPSTRKLHLKVVGNTKKFGGGGALADQEMGPGWSINSSIMSPEINLKCTKKQPKTKKITWGAHSAPQSPSCCIRLAALASYSEADGH